MNDDKASKLRNFGQALVNQDAAQIIVPPNQNKDGFWFGGGNMVEGPEGNLYVIGRYRNFGDSRTGLGMGERGLELAVFCSADKGGSFDKVFSLSKEELTRMHSSGHQTLSIEGTALRFTDEGVELYVSSEKLLPYPAELKPYLKPGSGRWTIEVGRARSLAEIKQFETIIKSEDPRWLHPKDPFFYERPDGDLLLGFVTHPYSWTGSNAGYAVRASGSTQFESPVYSFFQRGFTWDVAISRITAWLPVPQVGAFADEPVTLVFYDGGESMRNLDEHTTAVKRPRGYSCEEIGGLAVASADGVSRIERLSIIEPAFLSPFGTGCSRYVDVLATADGYYATWQQSQSDLSQPLVMNFLSREEAVNILS